MSCHAAPHSAGAPPRRRVAGRPPKASLCASQDARAVASPQPASCAIGKLHEHCFSCPQLLMAASPPQPAQRVYGCEGRRQHRVGLGDDGDDGGAALDVPQELDVDALAIVDRK